MALMGHCHFQLVALSTCVFLLTKRCSKSIFNRTRNLKLNVSNRSYIILNNWSNSQLHFTYIYSLSGCFVDFGDLHFGSDVSVAAQFWAFQESLDFPIPQNWVGLPFACLGHSVPLFTQLNCTELNPSTVASNCSVHWSLSLRPQGPERFSRVTEDISSLAYNNRYPNCFLKNSTLGVMF